jgi:hypothetical protein
MIVNSVYQDPVLLTIRSWSEEEQFISAMPNIAEYPNVETEGFMSRFLNHPLPWGYGSSTRIERCFGEGIEITHKIKTPDFDHMATHRLVQRVERFIQEELRILENGY